MPLSQPPPKRDGRFDDWMFYLWKYLRGSGSAVVDLSDYLFMPGRTGGQSIRGGTGASENLTLISTAHGTKGKINIGASSAYDDATVRLGVGTVSPVATIHAEATTEQVRVGYDGANYESTTVSATGTVSRTCTGGSWAFRAKDNATAIISLRDSAGVVTNEIRASTAALRCIGVGVGAHSALTTGESNNSFGVSSQISLTEGIANDAFGDNTQRSLLWGTYNCAFGREAQNALYASHMCSAFGTEAQQKLINGDGNSAFGARAQNNIEYGGNNTSVGSSSQYYTADGVTLCTETYNSTYIGARTNASENFVDNENVFGYLATGIGSNTVRIGNESVTKTKISGYPIFNPGNYAQPTEIGEITIEATNDTTLTFYFMGSDSVVRSAALTVS